MAKRQEPAAASNKTSPEASRLKKVLLWAMAGLILMVVSVGGTLYLSGALDRLGVGDAEAAQRAVARPGAAFASPSGPAQYLSLDPPFVVNFDDQGLLRYLQVNVSVMARDKAVIEAVQTHSPQIRYNLIVLFGGQDLATLSSAEGKERLRTLALREIQSILGKEIGLSGVEAVYFTNFVMQ